jgi:hypothetical protein
MSKAKTVPEPPTQSAAATSPSRSMADYAFLPTATPALLAERLKEYST